MALRLSTGLRTAMLGTSGIKELLDGWVDIYTGSQPLTADLTEPGTKLATISSTSGTGAADGVKFGTMAGAQFYIGLGHGPPFRIINENVCHGCFNDTSVKFDRGWDWCPHNKNYECTREITPAMVIEQIDKIRSV